MTESLEELIGEKNEFQTKANELKEKRNQLHVKSKNGEMN